MFSSSSSTTTNSAQTAVMKRFRSHEIQHTDQQQEDQGDEQEINFTNNNEGMKEITTTTATTDVEQDAKSSIPPSPMLLKALQKQQEEQEKQKQQQQQQKKEDSKISSKTVQKVPSKALLESIFDTAIGPRVTRAHIRSLLASLRQATHMIRKQAKGSSIIFSHDKIQQQYLDWILQQAEQKHASNDEWSPYFISWISDLIVLEQYNKENKDQDVPSLLQQRLDEQQQQQQQYDMDDLLKASARAIYQASSQTTVVMEIEFQLKSHIDILIKARREIVATNQQKDEQEERNDAIQLIYFLVHHLPSRSYYNFIDLFRGRQNTNNPLSDNGHPSWWSDFHVVMKSHIHLIAPRVAEYFNLVPLPPKRKAKKKNKNKKNYNNDSTTQIYQEEQRKYDDLKARFCERILEFHTAVSKRHKKRKQKEGRTIPKFFTGSAAMDEIIHALPEEEYTAILDSKQDNKEEDTDTADALVAPTKAKRNPRQCHVCWNATFTSPTAAKVDGQDQASPDWEERLVFVDNLPIDITKDELYSIYSRCGPLEHVEIFNQRLDLDPLHTSNQKTNEDNDNDNDTTEEENDDDIPEEENDDDIPEEKKNHSHPRKRKCKASPKRQRRGHHLLQTPWQDSHDDATTPSTMLRPKTPVYALLTFGTIQAAQAAQCDALSVLGVVFRQHTMTSWSPRLFTTLYLDSLQNDIDNEDGNHFFAGKTVEECEQILGTILLEYGAADAGLELRLDWNKSLSFHASGHTDRSTHPRFRPTSCQIEFPSFAVAHACRDILQSALARQQQEQDDVVLLGNETTTTAALAVPQVHWIRTPKDARLFWTREIGFD